VADLRIETRLDGSLVLTHTTGARVGWAIGPPALGVALLASVASTGINLLAAVLILPVAIIAILTGLAAARHRDWMIFDRPARALVYRRGIGGLFGRPVSRPFHAIEAIVVEDPSEGDPLATVGLRETGHGEARLWPIAYADPPFVQRLAAALHDVGGWPVLPKDEAERW